MDGQLAGANAGHGYQPMVPILVAMGLGIVIDRYAPPGFAVSFLVAISCSAAWLCAWIVRRNSCAALLLLAAVGTAAAAWHHDRWRGFTLDELGLAASPESRPICLEAIAQTTPRFQPAPAADPLRPVPEGDRTCVQVRVTRVRNGTRWTRATGRARLMIEGHLLNVGAGDRLRILGSLYAPRAPFNPGEFDFAEFNRHRRQLCGLHATHPDCVAVVQRGSTWQPVVWLNRVRAASAWQLTKYVGVPHADLAAAILLGSRDLVDANRTESFLKTGTVHLLAISGLHVGILVCGLLWLKRLRVVSRRTALWAAITFVILYACFTEARPPVVRAAVLVSVMCSASLFGRHPFAMNTLAMAGVLVLVMSPTYLFQVGTQLSFLAVVTLGSLGSVRERLHGRQGPLDRLIRRSRPWPLKVGRRLGQAIAEPWLASASVWLVATPLVMYRFHVIAPLAVVLNPLVLPPLVGALFAGFGVLIFGWFVPPLAELCGSCCGWCLAVMAWEIDTALTVEGNHVWTPSPPYWWVVGFYLALAIALVYPGVRPSCRWTVALVCAWFAVGMALTAEPAAVRRGSQPGQLTCTFVAVGHGTSVIVELPGGQTLLYDAGQLGAPSTAARRITSSLWSRGRTHLDAVIVSHADIDHFNALPGLLEKFTVGAVYLSPAMLRDRGAATRKLRDALRGHRIPVRAMARGDRLKTAGEATVEVLHPPPRGVEGSDNANSIVLRIDFAGRTLLLPGDLEDAGLDLLLETRPLVCDVVMAPHHGSPRSNPSRFAAWSSPRWVVVSSGHRRRAAVEQAYSEAGATVLNTATIGAVQVTVAGRDLRVRAWLTGGWP